MDPGAADVGGKGAAILLELLLVDPMDPPDLVEARRWYQQAADAGATDAARLLRKLLAEQWDADGVSRT